MNRTAFSMAMEAAVPDAVKQVEREITMYVRVDDLQDIIELSERSETHEQWNVNTDDDNSRMRIRLTDGVEYTATVKQKTRDENACIETEQEISKVFFDALKNMSQNGYKKTRYVIPAEGMDNVWEVDVFKDKAGDLSRWVKVDFEFKSNQKRLPDLPFDYRELILPDSQDGYEDEISRIWDEEWMRLDVDG